MSFSNMIGCPSLYLNELISLSYHKLIQALPPIIKPVIVSQSDLEIDRFEKMTDFLLLYFNKIETTQIQQVTLGQHRRGRSTNLSRTNDYPTIGRPINKDQKPKVCRTHLYFA